MRVLARWRDRSYSARMVVPNRCSASLLESSNAWACREVDCPNPDVGADYPATYRETLAWSPSRSQTHPLRTSITRLDPSNDAAQVCVAQAHFGGGVTEDGHEGLQGHAGVYEGGGGVSEMVGGDV